MLEQLGTEIVLIPQAGAEESIATSSVATRLPDGVYQRPSASSGGIAGLRCQQRQVPFQLVHGRIVTREGWVSARSAWSPASLHRGVLGYM